MSFQQMGEDDKKEDEGDRHQENRRQRGQGRFQFCRIIGIQAQDEQGEAVVQEVAERCEPERAGGQHDDSQDNPVYKKRGKAVRIPVHQGEEERRDQKDCGGLLAAVFQALHHKPPEEEFFGDCREEGEEQKYGRFADPQSPRENHGVGFEHVFGESGEELTREGCYHAGQRSKAGCEQDDEQGVLDFRFFKDGMSFAGKGEAETGRQDQKEGVEYEDEDPGPGVREDGKHKDGEDEADSVGDQGFQRPVFRCHCRFLFFDIQ